MSKTKLSAARVEEIFNSPPRLDIERTGKSTTIHDVDQIWSGTTVKANGGHERIAQILLEHLWKERLVRRWKPQAINLSELGGPNQIVDLLIELFDLELHVVEVKAKRFLDEQTQQKFAVAKDFLEPLAIGFHVWTNADVVGPRVSHTVNLLEKGRRKLAERDVIASIKEASKEARTLGDLFDQFGWDDVMSAAADCAIHFNIFEPIHEATPLLRAPSLTRYAHLFARRDAPQDWWDSLAPAVPKRPNCP